MINDNTITRLNMLGVGADIYSLEEQLWYMRQALTLQDNLVDKEKNQVGIDLLEELKRGSAVFNTELKFEVAGKNESDEVYKAYGIDEPVVVKDYGGLAVLKERIAEIGRAVDLVSYTEDYGYRFRVVYMSGIYYRATIIGKGGLSKDVTIQFSKRFPNLVETFRKTRLAEIQGIVSLPEKVYLERYAKRFIDRFIALTYLMDSKSMPDERKDLRFECQRILSLNNAFELGTRTEEFDFLEKNGFSVPEYALLRNSVSLNFNSTMDKIMKHFEADVNDKIAAGEVANYLGIDVSLNENRLRQHGSVYEIQLRLGYWDSEPRDAEVTGLEFEDNDTVDCMPVLMIKPIRFPDGNTVDRVKLPNFMSLVDKEINIGSHVLIRHNNFNHETYVV